MGDYQYNNKLCFYVYNFDIVKSALNYDACCLDSYILHNRMFFQHCQGRKLDMVDHTPDRKNRVPSSIANMIGLDSTNKESVLPFFNIMFTSLLLISHYFEL